MTYIWNRMDRVPKDKMPHVVKDCFNEWYQQETKNLHKLNDNEKRLLNLRVAKQLRCMNENLERLGYND